jgi:hypothetical protein
MRKILVAALLVGMVCAGCTAPKYSHVSVNATYPSILNPYPTIQLEATVVR